MPLVNNQTWDVNGNLIIDEWVDMPYSSLSGYQVVAALNAALGIWSLADAANVAGTTTDHLIAEVEGWAAAAAGM